ncbi:MAG: efflux transporter periplasmic adaptor subunit [Gemmatimonadetes bacterium]|nr:efflux transporter periplasmic adaptor subunit [Gemmatimonadota bacterium]
MHTQAPEPIHMTHLISSRASVALLVVGLIAAACSKPAPPNPAPEVTVASVIDKPIAEADEFTGHFEAVQSVEVRPRVTGYIQRVTFSEGATVRQGDPLFEIDPRPYEAELARAEAVLEQARTRQALARQEVERATRLVTTQAISREEFDGRTSGLAEASGAVRAAEASVRTARLNIEWSTVRAPIAGRVGRAEITRGNLVQASSPTGSLLTTIVSLDPIYVYFDTDEQLYLKNASAFTALRSVPGVGRAPRPVLIGLANESGFPHEGRLDFVDNQVDRAAGTIRVRAVVPNASHLFAPGLFARVQLSGGAARRALLIQDQAIGTDQDRKFVLVLKPDSSVEYRAITVGRVVNGLRIVESGLKSGESIVINGQLRVRPGMKVAAKHAAMQVAESVPAVTTAAP